MSKGGLPVTPNAARELRELESVLSRNRREQPGAAISPDACQHNSLREWTPSRHEKAFVTGVAAGALCLTGVLYAIAQDVTTPDTTPTAAPTIAPTQLLRPATVGPEREREIPQISVTSPKRSVTKPAVQSPGTKQPSTGALARPARVQLIRHRPNRPRPHQRAVKVRRPIRPRSSAPHFRWIRRGKICSPKSAPRPTR
jgi:hypothetical protein